MKKSKIILISLLCIIALVILAVFIDIRINGISKEHDKALVYNETIPSFKVLCINHSNLEIVQGDSSYIQISYKEDTLKPSIPYIRNGDTLIISGFRRYNAVKLFFKDSLNSIHLKNSNITIEHINNSELNLRIDSSYVWFDMSKDTLSSINFLNIVAVNHSTINTNRFRVDSIKINLCSSDAYLRTSSKKILGVLSNKSSIYSYQLEELLMKKDSTSKIYFYD